jgi:hypothetical protein
LVYGPQFAKQGRPAAKAALKAALHVIHEARVKGAEVAEAAEDLYAEAKAEVTQEVLAAVMAEAKAEAEEAAKAQHEPAEERHDASAAAAETVAPPASSHD